MKRPHNPLVDLRYWILTQYPDSSCEYGRHAEALCLPFGLGLILLLSGCASAPLPITSPTADQNIPLVLLELPPTVTLPALRRLSGQGDAPSLDDAALAKLRQDILKRLDTAVHAALKAEGLASASIMAVPAETGQTVGNPLPPAELQALQSRQPARYYFRVSVSDFGETPRSWLDGYVLFEVTATGVVSAALYSNPPTRALAGVYVAQEAVEELAEGYSGFWLVNRLSRPVRIEEDLVDGQNGKVLWHDSVTGMADWHWRNLWHMDAERRNGLLQEAMNKAAEKLARVLKENP